MNKYTILIVSIVSFVLVLTAAAVLMQDTDKAKKDPPAQLSTEIEMLLKQDYLDDHIKSDNPDATVDDVTLAKYYGTYDGSIAVMMKGDFISHITVLEDEVIDGITIQYGSSNRLLIWEDGVFYTLQEAYDKGILTKEDLIAISEVPFMVDDDYAY
ncbi:MAG: hypothetical protein LBR42_00425 [Candidatus Methanoplasma sp.]|jgi:hypothetical protein|nr:hypothetical protein [Candidatus Methanoplasma sp.]